MASKIKIKTINTGGENGTPLYVNEPVILENVTVLQTLADGELAYNAYNNGLYIGYNGENYLLSVTNQNGGSVFGEKVGSHFYGTADSANLAGTANKLSSGTKGSATQPVFFENGIPKVANAYSSLLTAVGSSTETNKRLTVTVGGTTKGTNTLYATHIKSNKNNATKGFLLGVTASDTTPFYDEDIYLDVAEGKLTAKDLKATNVVEAGVGVSIGTSGVVNLVYNSTDKCLEFQF